jgi:hypothetical protein
MNHPGLFLWSFINSLLRGAISVTFTPLLELFSYLHFHKTDNKEGNVTKHQLEENKSIVIKNAIVKYYGIFLTFAFPLNREQ